MHFLPTDAIKDQLLVKDIAHYANGFWNLPTGCQAIAHGIVTLL